MCDDVNVNCQSLLANEPLCHGWMKIKRRIHDLNTRHTSINKFAKKLANTVNWERKYFILCGPLIYIFKEETSKVADKILRLAEFSGVNETNVDNNDIPWPIEMRKKLAEKSYIFAPISERERTKWIEFLRIELKKLPTADEERSFRPLPTLPNLKTKKENKIFLKSLTENDEDDDPNENESSDEYECPNNDFYGVNNNSKIDEGFINESIKSNTNGSKNACNLLKENNIHKETFKSNTIDSRSQINLIKENSFRNGIAREMEQRQNSTNTATFPKRTPPQITFPKPKPNIVEKQANLPTLKDSRNPPIMKIHPILRPNSSPNDDGIYEIEYERNQNAEIGFWKDTAEEALKIIKMLIQNDGAFLIRKSQEADGMTLLVVNEKVIRKFPIQKEGTQITMGGNTFSNLEQLVSFHKKNNLPQKEYKLMHPYSYYIKK